MAAPIGSLFQKQTPSGRQSTLLGCKTYFSLALSPAETAFGNLCFSNTASHESSPTTSPIDTPRALLRKTITVGSVLFDRAYTSRRQPSPTAHYIIYDLDGNPSSTLQTTTSAPDSHRQQGHKNTMDGKKHPSSFQQLEKLGEGTYATVNISFDSSFGMA